MENPKENLIHEATNSPEKSQGGFEMSPEQASQITAELSKLNDAILHDKPISIDDLEDLSKVAKGTKINVDGEIMTVEGLESKAGDNLEIWKEIRRGDFSNYQKLTQIIAEIADILVMSSKGSTGVYLNKLTSISDSVAEKLAKSVGDLHLKGLKSISDKSAEYLATHNGGLSLSGITSLSRSVAEKLSPHKQPLDLEGLTYLSDEVAEALSRHGGDLYLEGLKSITDGAAKFLSKMNPKRLIVLYSLTTLSDKSAEYFSMFGGTVNFQGLTSISDTAAKYLAQSRADFWLNEKIKSQIQRVKFKK